MKGYCMKCRKMKDMTSVKNVVKKGRKYAMGKCKTCGTKMAKILGNA